MEKRHLLASKRVEGRGRRLAERSDEICARVKRLVDVIERVEVLLEECGQLLNVSQPPVSGKIGLRWWKMRGGQEEREPVVVIWKKGRNGRFYPMVVGISGALRRVKRGGGFALGNDVTRDVVRVMVTALRMRERLLKGLGGVDLASRVVTMVDYEDRVDGWSVDMGYWRTVMDGRLDGRFGG